MFTRKRLMPGTLKDTSADPNLSRLSTALLLSPIINLAIPKVCAGVSLSNPGTGTPCSLPTNSICGGRPGEKIKSLTLSETPSICCRTVARFRGAGGVFDGFAFSRGVLISESWFPAAKGRVVAQLQVLTGAQPSRLPLSLGNASEDACAPVQSTTLFKPGRSQRRLRMLRCTTAP